MLKGNYKVTFSYSESRYCLASISRLNSSREMFLGKKLEIFHFIPRLSQLSHDCFATKCFSRKPQCVSRLISRLSNSQKMRVFNFSKFPHFPRTASLEPLSTQNQFSLNPIIFKQKSLRITSRYVFLNIVSIFVLNYANFSLGF